MGSAHTASRIALAVAAFAGDAAGAIDRAGSATIDRSDATLAPVPADGPMLAGPDAPTPVAPTDPGSGRSRAGSWIAPASGIPSAMIARSRDATSDPEPGRSPGAFAIRLRIRT